MGLRSQSLQQCERLSQALEVKAAVAVFLYDKMATEPLWSPPFLQVLVEEPDFLDTPAGRAFKINADESGHPHPSPLPHPPTTGPKASATDAGMSRFHNIQSTIAEANGV